MEDCFNSFFDALDDKLSCDNQYASGDTGKKEKTAKEKEAEKKPSLIKRKKKRKHSKQKQKHYKMRLEIRH